MPTVSEEHYEAKTLVAFDHMRLSLSQLEWAHELVKVYRELLDDDNEKSMITEDGINRSLKPIEEKKEEIKQEKKTNKKKKWRF